MCDRPDEQYDYLVSLASHTDLPVILYEFPGMRPHLMDPGVYGRLAATGKFKGIKDTTSVLTEIEKKIAVQGDSNVLQANIPFLYDAYEKGARGVVATPTTCGADLFVKMWDAWVREDKAAAKAFYERIILLDNAIDSGFNASAKYICRLRGVNMEVYTRTGASLSPARYRSLEAYVDWAKSNGVF
jgi:4-hydroxy-tetrahydrodipicolinate synthase